MDLVVDANILFAVLIKGGKTEELIFNNDLHLFSPEFIFSEFIKYEDYLIGKTNRPKQDFARLFVILQKRIRTIPNEETAQFLAIAKKISPDPDDTDYFALALKMRCAIWSNDRKLKEQKEVIVYSTPELNEMMFKSDA